LLLVCLPLLMFLHFVPGNAATNRPENAVMGQMPGNGAGNAAADAADGLRRPDLSDPHNAHQCDNE
jgi:hypothetical protein